MAEKNIVQTESDTGQLTNIATTDIAGIASFNTDDFTVDADGKVSSKQKVGAIQYVGLPERYSNGGTEGLIWTVNIELSVKKYVEIVRNDLIMATDTVDDVDVIAGDVFKVLSTIDGKIFTDINREFNIRGPIGPEGPIGLTPNVTATASVDQTIGIATVDVVKTGTTEEANFDFAFSGIKGETGEKGDKGDNLYVAMSIEKGLLYLLQDSIMANDFILEDGCLYLEDE